MTSKEFFLGERRTSTRLQDGHREHASTSKGFSRLSHSFRGRVSDHQPCGVLGLDDGSEGQGRAIELLRFEQHAFAQAVGAPHFAVVGN